jgi:hypothetical protein
MHPFTYNGHRFTEEMEEVNRRAFDRYEHEYKVNVGADVYYFNTYNFFRGLIIGAKWSNIDPNTFITCPHHKSNYELHSKDLKY